MADVVSRVTAKPATPEEVKGFAELEGSLYSAVISDALDSAGFTEQAMAERLRPLDPSFRMMGLARTIACSDVYHESDDPYGLEIEANDSVLEGEVIVVSTQESRRNAPWGELLSTAARARGARGAVIDGLVRDVHKIQELGFPVFAAGIKPVDSKGRGIVIDYNVPVECGGVTVNPGDIIFADYDGVVVIPYAASEEVLRLATQKVQLENHTRAELEQGAYLRDVYEKYGVL